MQPEKARLVSEAPDGTEESCVLDLVDGWNNFGGLQKLFKAEFKMINGEYKGEQREHVELTS